MAENNPDNERKLHDIHYIERRTLINSRFDVKIDINVDCQTSHIDKYVMQKKGIVLKQTKPLSVANC